MDESITITRGPCDTEAPSAALAASSRPPVVETDVTLNASGSTDNDATLRTTFDRSGTYDARVTVVDRANNTANASVSLQVEAETTTTATTTATATTRRATTDSDVRSEPRSDGGVLEALSTNSSIVDGPSLLGLVVLTLALCGLAVAVVRR